MSEQRHEYSDQLWITTGVPGADQESSFMNATLQSVGNDPALEFSVACHVAVPGNPPSEEALRDYLHDVFQAAISAVERDLRFDPGTLNIEIQIGPGRGD